jgi:hypothetical protein
MLSFVHFKNVSVLYRGFVTGVGCGAGIAYKISPGSGVGAASATLPKRCSVYGGLHTFLYRCPFNTTEYSICTVASKNIKFENVIPKFT